MSGINDTLQAYVEQVCVRACAEELGRMDRKGEKIAALHRYFSEQHVDAGRRAEVIIAGLTGAISGNNLKGVEAFAAWACERSHKACPAQEPDKCAGFDIVFQAVSSEPMRWASITIRRYLYGKLATLRRPDPFRS